MEKQEDLVAVLTATAVALVAWEQRVKVMLVESVPVNMPAEVVEKVQWVDLLTRVMAV
jgi:hypothetical protein